MLALPPLTLYIHIPWCVRKCPYCDFNSHAADTIPETTYIDQLLRDLDADMAFVQGRKLHSIFFGGGTPSLFSGNAIKTILTGVQQRIAFEDNIEITLEANPGTAEANKFAAFFDAGVNRLSIGIQSFNATHLKTLGRIHDTQQAVQAVQLAQLSGFERINIDLMHGLPDQTCAEALADLQQAMDIGVTHLSWYQLTIEPNTAFYNAPPPLPVDDTLWDIQQAGFSLLDQYGFKQYEVSAFAKACNDRTTQQCRHNLNYWQFGDYLGIGAGAHGKITDPATGSITRYSKTRLPRHYLERTGDFYANQQLLTAAERPAEFLMNALRLRDGVPSFLYTQRTGLQLSTLAIPMANLIARGLLSKDPERLCTTGKGYLFLNDVLGEFL